MQGVGTVRIESVWGRWYYGVEWWRDGAMDKGERVRKGMEW